MSELQTILALVDSKLAKLESARESTRQIFGSDKFTSGKFSGLTDGQIALETIRSAIVRELNHHARRKQATT
jgi:hypothetical protein